MNSLQCNLCPDSENLKGEELDLQICQAGERRVFLNIQIMSGRIWALIDNTLTKEYYSTVP
jgi:hypothetical protein